MRNVNRKDFILTGASFAAAATSATAAPPNVHATARLMESHLKAELVRHKLTAELQDETNAPWNMLGTKLREYLTQNSGDSELWKGLQLVTLPTVADWNDPRWGSTRIHALAGYMPHYGPDFVQTSTLVEDAYYEILSAIGLKQANSGDTAKADAAFGVLKAKIAEKNRIKLNLIAQWSEYNKAQSVLDPADQITYKQWLSQNTQQLDQVNAQITKAQSDAQYWFLKAYGGEAWAASLLARFNDDNNSDLIETEVPPPPPDVGRGTYTSYRRFSINGDLQKFIDDAKGGHGNAITISINKGTHQQDFQESHWGASASWLGIFGANGSSSTASVNTQDDTFNLTYSIKSIQYFPVTPGNWYVGAMIRHF